MKEAASVGGLFQSGFRNAFMKNDTSIALSRPPEPHGVPGGVIGASMVRKVDHREFHQWPRRRPQYPPPPNNSNTTTIIRINSIGILR